MTTFDDFINNLDDTNDLDLQKKLEKQKNIWLNQLDKLYQNIKLYLKPYENKVKISEQDIILNEEFIGEYSVPKLFIVLGKDTVTLTPKGTNLIGVMGRVDMESAKGKIMLVLDEPSQQQYQWEIAKPARRIEYSQLNKESFQQALMEVVNA